ncbi:hypothetical protein [Qipengyuania sp. JC766]|uniref:hypothetical protein n=1 Tax=Qipengyuania sp. JC766 TaxID=3232139 RepID=UPI003459ACD2
MAQEEQQEREPQYSDEFRTAYPPVDALVNEQQDYDAARAQIPSLVASATTPDDKNVAGGLLFKLGQSLSDSQVQLQGINLMLESNLGGPVRQGQLRYATYSLYEDAGDLEAARAALEEAASSGYATEGQLTDGTKITIDGDYMRLMAAETYFQNDQTREGLAYVDNLVSQKMDANELPSERLLSRALGEAFGADLLDDAGRYSVLLVKYFPNEMNWKNALAVERAKPYGDPISLDLLRLASRTDNLETDRDYSDYIQAADVNRLPAEVNRVFSEMMAKGVLENSPENTAYANELRSDISDRLENDREDLPALEADARGAGASATLVTRTADSFFSHENYATAEELYDLALTKADSDRDLLYTRKGIAQIEQGKFSEALGTLAQVQGQRKQVADLWAAYAQQQMS